MKPVLLLLMSLAGAVQATGQHIDSLEALLPQTEGRQHLQLLLQLADAYGARNWEQSVVYAEQSLALAREYDDDSLLFEACHQLSESLHGLGNYAGALALGEEAWRLAFDERSKSRVLYLMGFICQRRAEYERSLEYYLAALEIDRGIGDRKRVINTMNSISFVYRYMEQYDKAIGILKECLELSSQINDTDGMARATFNIGFNLVENNQGEEAIPYFRRAIVGMKEEDEPYRFSAYYNNMSNSYHQMVSQDRRYLDSCLYYARKNLVLKERLHDHTGIANAHNQLASIHLLIPDYERVRDHGKQALHLADSLDFKRIRKNALLYLIIGEMASRNLELLRNYFSRYEQVTESLSQEAHSRTLGDMAVKYETEKKEAENQRLKDLSIQQAKLNMALGAGGGLLLIMVTLLGFFYRRLDRHKKTIETQSHELLRLDNLRSEFFANISHELRTPLTLAAGNLELALEDRTSEAVADKLENSKRNLYQLGRMIEDLLDLSKLEAGRYTLNTAPVAITPFMIRMVSAFQSVYEERGIRLVFTDHTTHTHHVLLDTRHFEKVINNLLYNALKFTHVDGRVEVSVYDQQKGVAIQVSDNGVGIPQGDIPFVFERFHQAHGVNRDQGTGLGLAIAREIVELHGGTITVQSTAGSGTTFNILLDGTEQSEEVVDQVDPGEWISNQLLNWPSDKPQVLVVEDNADMRRYLEDILQTVFRIHAVGDGEEALEWLRSNTPALVISDVMMPRMDGYTLLQEVKDNPSTAMLPVVLLTARASAHDRIRGLRLGVDDYITKPFDHNELLIRALNLVKNLHNRVQWAKESAVEEEGVARIASRKDEIDRQMVDHAVRFVEDNITRSDLTVDEVAMAVGISRAHFYRRLTLATGLTPNQFINEVRLQRARALLMSGSIVKLSQLASEVGIATPAYLSRLYLERFGKKPAEYL